MTPAVVTAGSASPAADIIAALCDPARYAHRVDPIEVLETHISWVILTGQYAYKIKKPVNLGFLDFSTLEARRRYCEEELRLNRRLAPTIYEGVVPITGDAAHPVFNGHGTAIEYAVKMRQFSQGALAGRLLDGGALNAAHMDALATRIATFHAHTSVAAQGCQHGTPDAVILPARDNFVQLDGLLPDAADQILLAELRSWTEHEYQTHWRLFRARHAQGDVRECHGDLHLGNIVMLDGALTPFDCIEFNPAMRWIDVMSDVAFLQMDLTDRNRADLAFRFLNTYLEHGGDYPGLAVLRFYRVYRAMVRAKIHALRAQQGGLARIERPRLIAASRGYINLAHQCAHDGRAGIILMHGLSGSGKSVLAQAFADKLSAIRLRSDSERKRLRGLTPLARSSSSTGAGIYTADLTQATYHRLLDLARLCVRAGHAAIIDATCLKHWQRDLFHREAAIHGIPFVIVNVTAPEATLRTRIAARLATGSDASEAGPSVLTHQLAQCEALTDDESTNALHIDTSHTDTARCVEAILPALRARLAA
jgi:uncharacterized protein